MANTCIRQAAKCNKVAHWKIAEALGIHEAVFSRMMRHDLDSEETKRILAIIEELKKKED